MYGHAGHAGKEDRSCRRPDWQSRARRDKAIGDRRQRPAVPGYRFGTAPIVFRHGFGMINVIPQTYRDFVQAADGADTSLFLPAVPVFAYEP